MESIRDLDELLRHLDPAQAPDEYVFACVTEEIASTIDAVPIGMFREDEGVTLILEKADADAAGVSYPSTLRLITLTVPSSLEAVGLTAAVSRALADAGIAVNMVAAFHHDHLFVPVESAVAAMEILGRLQTRE